MLQDIWFPAKESSAVVGRFVDIEKVDVKASEEAQRAIMKVVPALEAKVAGGHDISVQIVKPFNKNDLTARFPGAWEHYEKLKAMTSSEPIVPIIAAIKGMPLDQADFIPRERIRWLAAQGFTTVEQLRDMSDATVQTLGRGALSWRKKATEHLKRT